MTNIKSFSRYTKVTESKISDTKCDYYMEFINKGKKLPLRENINPQEPFEDFIAEETYKTYNKHNHTFVYSTKYGCWGYIVGAGRNVNKSSQNVSIHFDVLIPSPRFVEYKRTNKQHNSSDIQYKISKLEYCVRTTWTYKTFDKNNNLVEVKDLIFETADKRDLIEKFFVWDIQNCGYVTNDYLDYLRNSKRIIMPYKYAFDFADILHYNIITNLISERNSNFIDDEIHYKDRLNYEKLYNKNID